MKFERSRAWVKARIPAFICKETNWWVSKWIQANVFLCPHCRQEYRSLKKVWDCLDEWESETPGADCESHFSNTLRDQFPSAFRQEEAPESVLRNGYGKLAFAGGVLAVGIACMMVLPGSQNVPTSGGTDGARIVQETQRTASPALQVAQSGAQLETDVPTPDRSSSPSTIHDLLPPSDTIALPGNMVRTVSYDTTSTATSRMEDPNYGRHLIEINSHPVVGFSTLAFSTEEDAY